MSREILQNIITNFDLQRLKRFFSEKNSKFRPSEESYDYYNTDNFSGGLKLGELSLNDGVLLTCAFEAKQELSERSGKKAQYELGKKILKETQADAGIFIYHNQAGSFRFSLIYANYLGKKRDWSAFRRFTYFVGNDLTNKTFKQRIGDSDFSSLEKIKDAFSVEKVTKEFYEDIANWYFWAVEHSTFPKDAKAEKDGRNIAVIRLITRIIFIWFMRERGLVPKDLFEEKNITSILKSISAEDSTYYTAILQNLFFATLSTKKDERKFRSEIRGYKGYNPDFGNQNVFRFQELFKNPEKLKDYFSEIPFLNGGLFECLDDKPNGIYIDGFTSVKKNQPTVPNFLFFSGEQKTDLNTAYGTKNKTYKVRGLLDILSSYNFTIDENSPDDQDIALDPELLGRVFENLLASFNPETSTTARKATGSYYTPREIVDYMVTESLKAYFKTHLSAISDLDKKIVQLFSTASEENPFDKSESKKIAELIESVRIVDPAVGSGAFPMGALNKLVFILNKVDPGNELWKQAQLLAADTIPDPRIKQDTKTHIEEFFKGKNADYGRKLYLIQKCIYGVDIQQIAVEIAKLRFFISLLVHEDIDKKKENLGIEPLPNLDFKIMQGNSLISEFLGIDFDNGQEKQDLQGQVGFGFENEDDSLIKEFERKKIDYQNESDKDKKSKLKDEVEDLMINLFEAKLQKKYSELKPIEERAQSIPNLKTREMYIKTEKEKFSKKHGFDLGTIEKQLWEFTSKKKTRPFFPWRLYFAEVFSEKKIEKDWKAYHITWVTHNSRVSERMVEFGVKMGEPVILDEQSRMLIADALAEKIQEKHYRVLAVNVLFDHAHCVVVCEEKEASDIVQNLKGYTSHKHNRLLQLSVEEEGRQCHLWAKGSSQTLLESDDHIHNALEYVQNNHLKHEVSDIASSTTHSKLKHAVVRIENAFDPVIENGGFDIVIANPPYIDSETMVKEQPVLRQWYSELYSTAKGNWDLYVPFLELGHKILTNTGIASFITPNKWFAIGYGKEIRKKLIGNIYRIANCNSVKVFEAGNSPVVTIFGKNSQAKEVKIDKFDNNYSIVHSLNIKRRFLADNLGLALSDFLSIVINIRNQPKKISDYYVSENPCSVSEAYEIKKILKDLSSYKDSDRPYFRFVNTGTIDPFFSLWGKKNTTYLKSKYYNPIVNKLIFQKLFPKRYTQTIKPKLIISGMRHFESFFDEEGQYIAGKSTEILFEKNEISLKVALGILNSRLISFYIKQAYSVLGIDGGINFTTDLIESLPIPELNTIDIQKPFIEIVDKILAITKSTDSRQLKQVVAMERTTDSFSWRGKQEEVKEYEKQIDQMVYKLYGLTLEEIAIVEGKNVK